MRTRRSPYCIESLRGSNHNGRLPGSDRRFQAPLESETVADLDELKELRQRQQHL